MVWTYSLRVANQLIRGRFMTPRFSDTNKLLAPFRCWPVDIDLFWHMNNAKYVRVAELTRWYAFSVFGMSQSLQNGTMFLVFQQKVAYYKPIAPMQRYVVELDAGYSPQDDKWLYYRQTFLQHPDDVKSGQTPIKYAEVVSKAVVKEKGGKTIPASQFANSAAKPDVFTILKPDQVPSF